MGFKVRLDELQAIRNGIAALPKMGQKVSYDFKRIGDKVTSELRRYQEQAREIYKELGELDPKDNKYKVAPEKREELNRRLDELNSHEVEIDREPIKLARCVMRAPDGQEVPVDIEPETLMWLGAAVEE